MDYLLDQYFFKYVPFDVSDEWKKYITGKAVHLIRIADWICKAQDPLKLYENHTSFLACELVFFFLCLLTFIHAYRKGNRYLYVWLGILIHSLNVENLCYWIPDLDNFWQAQGLLTFFGMRAPLYIILGIYHTFDYIAYVFVRRLHLPWWAEGPAVGLGAVMLDMPYDIMGIKLLWWTWHDTDPNIYDRMYWVPWNSYYFHASFACSFVWILNFTRKLLVDEVYDWKKFGREFLCAFLAGTLAFWFGSFQFALIYHPAHDIFGVHSEITTCVFLGIYALIVWVGDRHNKNPEARAGNTYWFDELALAVATHYLFYMVLVLVADPVNIVAEGLHQPIGPCNVTQKVQTPTGLILEKKKYLCLDDYDEKYFDFHCLPKDHALRYEGGADPLEWYAICGTKFDNRAEYVFIIWSICILFGSIFFQMAARSGSTPRVYRIVYRSPYRSGDRKRMSQEEQEPTRFDAAKHSPDADIRSRQPKSTPSKAQSSVKHADQVHSQKSGTKKKTA